MKALNIKDLADATELDRKEMAAVRGGLSLAMPSFFGPEFSFTKNEFNVNAAQSMQQGQNTLVNNGNNAAFVSGITSNVTPSQSGHNDIHLG